MRYAEIAVNTPVSGTFHYHIPSDFTDPIEPGHLVRMAFGTAVQPGVVVALDDTAPVERTKPILGKLDPHPVVTLDQIAWARWMSEHYLTPLGLCLWLWLPPGIAGKRDMVVTLQEPDKNGISGAQSKIIDLLQERGTLTGQQIKRSLKRGNHKKAILDLRDRGTVQVESVLLPPTVKRKVIQVAALAIHPERIDDTLRYLGKPNRTSDLMEQVIRWHDDHDTAPTVDELLVLPGIGSRTVDSLLETDLVTLDAGEGIKLNFFRQDVDEVLFKLRQGETDLHILRVLGRENTRTGNPVDVDWIYAQTGATLDDLKRLEAREFIQLGERREWRDPLARREFVPLSPPRLTSGQRDAWSVIRAGLDDTSGLAAFLLHGVTGSGKTEIYLRAIERVLARGQQAILLVPEIALTAQTVRRVMARFPGQVSVIGDADETDSTTPGAIGLVHSRLTPGQRYDTWQRARAGEIQVVVGTRSALFTLLPDVGLIILDEEHDSSYKQAAPTRPPYYHAREVAERMMRDGNGTLILGSATPDVGTRYRAERGDLTYLHLPDRIMGHRVRITEQAEQTGLQPHYVVDPSDDSDALHIPLPPVEVVDMREELKSGNTEMFSHALKNALIETLTQRQQVMLYLNRRGTATYVFCRDCGYVANCPRCDMPLTYHHYDHSLRCHHCGHQQKTPDTCPDCGSPRIKYFGAGTQQVEAALQKALGKRFPDMRVLRWDSDTASKPGSHDLILQRFLDQQADVLIGTQMIAKGLDLPLVTLVGVVSADMGLALPDYRAGERVFQLLTQVAGRAGRGLLGGKVILQTYQPGHYAVAAAAQHDYDGFYGREIAYRRQMGYPPFRGLVRIICQDKQEWQARDQAAQAAYKLREAITKHKMTEIDLTGPAPCFFGRVNQRYRWQVILRGPNPADLLKHIEPDARWHIDVDPVDIL